jgi:hypothetical protein
VETLERLRLQRLVPPPPPLKFEMTPKVKIAIEQIARMRVAGIRDGIIAVRMGLSQAGLSRIVALDEYREYEESVLQGLTSKMDEALAGKVKEMEAYFAQGVPVALSTLLETCRQRRDLRAAMSAATEILDRDPKGTFSKKRVSIDDNAQAPSVSAEMLGHLNADADAAAVAALEKTKVVVN